MEKCVLGAIMFLHRALDWLTACCCSSGEDIIREEEVATAADVATQLASPLSATINQCGAFSSYCHPNVHSPSSSSSSSSSSLSSLFMFLAIIWLNIALVSRAAGPLAVHLYRVVAAAACGILLSSKPTLSYMQQTYFDKWTCTRTSQAQAELPTATATGMHTICGLPDWRTGRRRAAGRFFRVQTWQRWELWTHLASVRFCLPNAYCCLSPSISLSLSLCDGSIWQLEE